MKPLTISVIIPALNEEESIASLLSCLKTLDSSLEIIVSDGGSRDRTREFAGDTATVIESPRGRGVQMNNGAAAASGDVLWFLHADVIPPESAPAQIQNACKKADLAGGAFGYALDAPGLRYRLVEALSNWKNRTFKLLFGDMGIFVRRSVFYEMGGYKEIPLMEDMDFSRRLKRMGRVVVFRERMMTSARRWRKEGYLWSAVRSWILQTAWRLGVSPDVLAKWYRFK